MFIREVAANRHTGKLPDDLPLSIGLYMLLPSSVWNEIVSRPVLKCMMMKEDEDHLAC